MDAATRWARIQESELEVAGVSSGTGFGRSVGLRIRGKIFAIYNERELILKQEPRRRTNRLRRGQGLGSGDGHP